MKNSENNENEELSSALINIKDNLMKFKKESDNKQEYEQAKELFSHLEEKALSFEREYAEVEKLNKRAQETYNFQNSKKINLKEKIENEKNQIEELGNKYRDLQIQNKKLEIDELNIEVDKLEDKEEIIENQIEQLKHKNSEISEKLRLSKAQNEYVEYKENKDNANQKKIQIDKIRGTG